MKNSFNNLANRLYQLGIIDKETKEKFSITLFEQVAKKKEEQKNKYIKALENNAKLNMLMEIIENDDDYLVQNEEKILELLDSIGVTISS